MSAESVLRCKRAYLARGGCITCGQPLETAHRCARHAEAEREKNREKYGYHPWRTGGAGRPPIVKP